MYEFDGGLQDTSTDVVDRGDVLTLLGASGVAVRVYVGNRLYNVYNK